MDDSTASLLQFLDFALRGGAAGVSMLIAGLFVSIRPRCAVTLFGALFAVGAAVYSVVLVEPIQSVLGASYVPLKLLAMLSPAFFWLFIIALFDDDFSWKPWMAAPPVAIAILHFICLVLPPLEQASRLAHVVIVLALMAHVLYLTHRSLGDDLVAARRQFTTILIGLVPLVCATIAIIEIYEFLGVRGGFASPAIAAMLFIVTAAFGVGITGIRRSLLPQPVAATRHPETTASAADRFDLVRLEKLMADGVYLNSGLTIGELAGLMNIPEHRLRRLINKGLGYRNFAAFINDHRIEEARRRLSVPETAREQITSLAFDVGYSSLAPFNRAFRERIGMSPSQYREKALQSG